MCKTILMKYFERQLHGEHRTLRVSIIALTGRSELFLTGSNWAECDRPTIRCPCLICPRTTLMTSFDESMQSSLMAQRRCFRSLLFSRLQHHFLFLAAARLADEPCSARTPFSSSYLVVKGDRGARHHLSVSNSTKRNTQKEKKK